METQIGNAVALGREQLLSYARAVAEEIALQREDHTISTNDVANELAKRGQDISALGNAAGALFKGGKWAFTGRFVPADRAASHRRNLRLWTLMV